MTYQGHEPRRLEDTPPRFHADNTGSLILGAIVIGVLVAIVLSLYSSRPTPKPEPVLSSTSQVIPAAQETSEAATGASATGSVNVSPRYNVKMYFGFSQRVEAEVIADAGLELRWTCTQPFIEIRPDMIEIQPNELGYGSFEATLLDSQGEEIAMAEGNFWVHYPLTVSLGCYGCEAPRLDPMDCPEIEIHPIVSWKEEYVPAYDCVILWTWVKSGQEYSSSAEKLKFSYWGDAPKGEKIELKCAVTYNGFRAEEDITIN